MQAKSTGESTYYACPFVTPPLTAASNIFRRATHPPADVRQATANFGQSFFVLRDGVDVRFFGLNRVAILLALFREKPQPPPSHIAIRPRRHNIGTAS
jgi:hypothetical protein